MNEMTIEELIEKKVQEELSKYRTEPRRLSDGWLTLRKQITIYIHENTRENNISFSGLQEVFYKPIKYILGLKRIDEMTNEQAIVAREIFEFLKNKKYEESKQEA